MESTVDHEVKWIKHYSSRHQILLVGEGDFSFAACLARAFGNASNVVATSLHSQGVIKVEVERDKNHLVVIGEGVDSVKLVNSLRKKFCFAQIVIVKSVVTEESGFRQDEFQRQTFNNNPTQYIAYPVHDPYPPTCSIL
ncbi:hypothetical protein BUALT_Bualt03G0100300 [Buddleja alternifolia]|uniref:25S rRNA (uridine-N(3))-methyltransferase BMT5-like domain-containing protein n=1 Tax=Buddleja alternifolia TaxID=168488 RepID=A0AAV6XU59_9LAMI|nr:hypothetical protein BUALT_Bualt03G0100300 [Buddleja alternifolia]